MADERKKGPGQGEPDRDEPSDFGALTGGDDDSGLGNLPPLSDFDSGPPAGDEDFSSGGLPPMDDLAMNTPSPMEDETAPIETPVFGGKGGKFDTPRSDLDTPEPEGGFGFQDLAADSDFSPETPEIGPGPDSDIETPLFDSAFGGQSGGFDTPRTGQKRATTSTPTRAMETPMFEAGSPLDTPSPDFGGTPTPEFGFDRDAFGAGIGTGGGTSGLGEGTPLPDFSPDTGLQRPGGVTPAPVAPPPRRRRRAAGVLVSVLFPIIALAAGIVASPFLADYTTFLPNPLRDQIDEQQTQISQLEDRLRRAVQTAPGDTVINQEEIDRRLQEAERLQQEIQRSTAELQQVQQSLIEAQRNLELVQADVDQKNAEFVQAEEYLEQVRNETALTEARNRGLLAENERLEAQVGQLEVADQRRQATKDALVHNLDLLIIQIRQGIPLAPQKYAREARLQRATALREKAAAARWVDPELMNEYTQVYQDELEIASSREYFFARIPVHDQLGSVYMKWAECLMNGNWSVYYATIDGQHVGVYENIAGTSPPEYGFREDLSDPTKQQIREMIQVSRVEGFEQKIEVLRAKDAVYETKSNLQRVFDSL